MNLREWSRLAFTRRMFRRRFLQVPVALFVVAAVGYSVASERWVGERVFWFESQFWTAEYDEERDEFVVAHRNQDDWVGWMRAGYDGMKAGDEVAWAMSFGAVESQGMLTRRLGARIGPPSPSRPEFDDVGRQRASAAIDAEYRRSRLGRRFPQAAQLAASSPDGRVELHRNWPVGAMFSASVVVLWLLAVAAVIGAFVPRRDELAAYRRERGQCGRCRYDLRQLSGDVCPECGAAQGVAASSRLAEG
jgi:hypothetical protein